MTVKIDKWIAMVSTLLSPALPGDAIEALNAIKPHMAGFAPSAFTAETARHVAEAERYGPVPGWDKIAPILRAAVSEATPINGYALPAPDEPEYRRPDADEIGRIDELLARAGFHRKVDRQDPEPTVLRDVSLRGGKLAAARARGILVIDHQQGGDE